MKRLCRWLLRAVMLISVLLSIATTAFWIRGTDWLGHCSDFTRHHGHYPGTTYTDLGQRWTGLYSHAGQIGLVHIEAGVSGLEPDELQAVQSPPSAPWFWNRTGQTNGWEGPIPDELSDVTPDNQIPHCLFLYNFGDAGMRHYSEYQLILISDATLLILTSILSALSLTLLIRRLCRHKSGHCPTCGYDLRATPDRCPECGTIPAKANNSD